MNILKLEPGDIIVHELFGDLTILQRDIENERYLVVVEEYKEIIKPQWIYFQEVEEVCEIKNDDDFDFEYLNDINKEYQEKEKERCKKLGIPYDPFEQFGTQERWDNFYNNVVNK